MPIYIAILVAASKIVSNNINVANLSFSSTSTAIGIGGPKAWEVAAKCSFKLCVRIEELLNDWLMTWFRESLDSEY